jgi:hypothetical protein
MRLSNALSVAVFKNLSCALLAVVFVAGCIARAADDASTSSDLSTDADRSTDTNQPSADKAIKLDGKGRQASEKFMLEPGLAIFELNHDGESNVVIRLLDRDGKSVDTLFNQIGAFNGQRGFTIPEAGEYLLDVSADGNWAVAIRQPRPTTGRTDFDTLEGIGYGITPLVELEKGLNVFKMRHNGKGRFTVNLMDRDGHKIESLINTLGEFDGSKPVSVEKPGIYFLNVAGDGYWSIDLQ